MDQPLTQSTGMGTGQRWYNPETGNYDLTSYEAYQDKLISLNQQNETPQDALTQLERLSKEDPAYKELYLQLLAERENNDKAWERYENFNNSYYQRTTKDLEKAGLNPWLSLQSLGSSGNGSISPSGTWSSSAYGNKASMKQADNTATKAGLALAGVIAAALIYALL